MIASATRPVSAVPLPDRDSAAVPTRRNLALDAYRGLVMLLMLAEVLQLPRVARAFPDNPFWQFLAFHQSHVAWAGCSLHDLIQPSFSFLVGAALPYSLASRLAKGTTWGRMAVQALWRSFLLVALGIFLRSTHSPQTNFTFEDTLTQIGLGYPFLFLLAFSVRRQWTTLGILLAGYWLAWALYPVPGGDFAAHWSKNSNLGVAFDQWFLNLFPRSSPFVANRGGYVTLSFIPTLGTMLLGLIAGRWLRDAAPAVPLRRLPSTGAVAIAAGLALHAASICPIVKRIWTPSWTLFSGGLCLLLLAGLSWLIEVRGHRRWTFPLVIIGANSIAAYLMAHLWDQFLVDSFRIHLGPHAFELFGTALAPLVQGAAVLLAYWLILFWMHRRNIFLRV